MHDGRRFGDGGWRGRGGAGAFFHGFFGAGDAPRGPREGFFGRLFGAGAGTGAGAGGSVGAGAGAGRGPGRREEER